MHARTACWPWSTPYFERPEPEVFDEEGTYVPTDVPIASTRNYSWNHGLGEIVTALMDAGMQLTMLEEHDSVPWEALPGQMEEVVPNEWRVIDRPWRVPTATPSGRSVSGNGCRPRAL